jgi:hypothetical protein
LVLLLLLRVLGPCLIRFIDFRTQQCSPANKKTRSGTSTHLSEQRRCCSADGGLAAHLISSHMPLLRSKLRSDTVGEDHVITSFASNLLRRCRRWGLRGRMGLLRNLRGRVAPNRPAQSSRSPQCFHRCRRRSRPPFSSDHGRRS